MLMYYSLTNLIFLTNNTGPISVLKVIRIKQIEKTSVELQIIAIETPPKLL